MLHLRWQLAVASPEPFFYGDYFEPDRNKLAYTLLGKTSANPMPSVVIG